MESITIKGEGISREVTPVLVKGNLAVTPDFNNLVLGESNYGKYRITHIPTGWAVFPPIRTKVAALQVLNAALETMDWDFKSPKSKKLRAQREQYQDIRTMFSEYMEY
jgi:hypothetical protein